MTDKELITALKRMMVETGSLICMGCGHEHNCGIHGCAILGEAVEKLEKMQWTRPEDKLPKPLESVLICRPKRARNDPLTVDMGYLRPDGTWRVRGTPLNRIRGWMPCPVPMEDDD